MKIYIVTRNGIYMQGVVGVYTSKVAANFAIARAKAMENDDYHVFKVDEVSLDRDAFVYR